MYVQPTRSPRAYVRRAVVRRLRELVAPMHSQISRWTPGGTVYEEGAATWRRPRELAEFPENDPAAMRTSARELRWIAAELVTLASELEVEVLKLERK